LGAKERTILISSRGLTSFIEKKTLSANPIIPTLHYSIIPAQWLLAEPKSSGLAPRASFSMANKRGAAPTVAAPLSVKNGRRDLAPSSIFFI
jgi:hypothetical protein